MPLVIIISIKLTPKFPCTLIQLQIVSKLLLFVNFRGSNSAEGGTYQLADMYLRGPNPLADMDQGVHIRGESKSAVTPV